MNDDAHLRLHRSRREEAERRHAVAAAATPHRRTLLTRALRAFGATRPGRRGTPATAVRYAGSGVAGERVE